VTDERTLDGNAVGGLLWDVFGSEVTAALGTCAHCGATEPVGAVTVYVHAPGVVVRCPHCTNVLIRIVTDGAGRYWLDFHGVRLLEVRVEG
jgi:hypothetical protein